MTPGMKFVSAAVILLLLANLAALVTIRQEILDANHRTFLASEQISTIADSAESMLKKYEEDAYKNPEIDRIAEQQLLAAETEITILILLIRALELRVW